MSGIALAILFLFSSFLSPSLTAPVTIDPTTEPTCFYSSLSDPGCDLFSAFPSASSIFSDSSPSLLFRPTSAPTQNWKVVISEKINGTLNLDSLSIHALSAFGILSSLSVINTTTLDLQGRYTLEVDIFSVTSTFNNAGTITINGSAIFSAGFTASSSAQLQLNSGAHLTLEGNSNIDGAISAGSGSEIVLRNGVVNVLRQQATFSTVILDHSVFNVNTAVITQLTAIGNCNFSGVVTAESLQVSEASILGLSGTHIFSRPSNVSGFLFIFPSTTVTFNNRVMASGQIEVQGFVSFLAESSFAKIASSEFSRVTVRAPVRISQSANFADTVEFAGNASFVFEGSSNVVVRILLVSLSAISTVQSQLGATTQLTSIDVRGAVKIGGNMTVNAISTSPNSFFEILENSNIISYGVNALANTKISGNVNLLTGAIFNQLQGVLEITSGGKITAATLQIGDSSGNATLQGSGTIVGNLELLQGTITPGSASIGEINIIGTCTLKHSSYFFLSILSDSAYDKLTCSGAISIENSFILVSGNPEPVSFIRSDTSLSGSFGTVIPAHDLVYLPKEVAFANGTNSTSVSSSSSSSSSSSTSISTSSSSSSTSIATDATSTTSSTATSSSSSSFSSSSTSSTSSTSFTPFPTSLTTGTVFTAGNYSSIITGIPRTLTDPNVKSKNGPLASTTIVAVVLSVCAVFAMAIAMIILFVRYRKRKLIKVPSTSPSI